jgi:hypothetical protein
MNVVNYFILFIFDRMEKEKLNMSASSKNILESVTELLANPHTTSIDLQDQ